MFNISKEFEFDAAHRLMFHNGKCKNVHGHRYKVIVTISQKELDSDGIVKDFSDLKWIKNWIDENRDHGYIFKSNDSVVSVLKQEGLKIYDFGDQETTAENIAKFLFDMIKKIEKNLSKVVVYETPTSSADYCCY